MFRPKDSLDRLFAIGIIGKGLNGLAELVGGLLLLFVAPDSIRRIRTILSLAIFCTRRADSQGVL